MADYSFIKTIELENFMSIAQAELEFDEKNIVSICGFNDTGKSAITRACAVLFYDQYSRDQVRFIKDGADYFKVGMTFSDGVSISKIKTINGQSIWNLSQNGNTLYTNKLGNSIQAVTEVPEPIRKYLGVLYDDCTDSFMNVRRNTDRLFLIDTTGGDNYKILNTILKSDVLAKASMAMTQDKNKLNSELGVKTNQFNALVQQYEAIEVAPESDIEKLHNLTKSVSALEIQRGELNISVTAKNAVDATVIMPEIAELDTSRIMGISEISENYNKSKAVVMPEVLELDSNAVTAIADIITNYKTANQPIMPEVKDITSNRCEDIFNTGTAYQAYANSVEKLNTMDNELKAVTEELSSLAKQYNLRICKNCGTVVTENDICCS